MTATTDRRPRRGRSFDVVLWGATGFTGQLVAEYLLVHYGVGKNLRWALGGRNKTKLEAVRASLSAIDPRAADLPLLIGDARDEASLAPIVRDTGVLATTVGPYFLHGKEMVAACVEAGTDYCDLTGETPFIREMIDRHHERARVTGARIVHCCGYDSIPSDLGTLMVQEHMRKTHGGRCVEVKHFAGESKGGVSGGTVASMVLLVEEASRDTRIRRIVGDPYALDPGRKERGPDGPDQRGVRWEEDLGRWTGPFVMAAINTRVVRRSNALLDYAYGRDFRYREAMSFASGPRGWLTAASMSVAATGFVAALAVPPIRSFLARRVLPAPGEGPSKEKRDSGYFTSRLIGTGAAKDGKTVKVLGLVAGKSDPGYGETAKMLSESAVCLALDDGTRREGGVLTPASTMGMRLVERLRDAGMTFETREL